MGSKEAWCPEATIIVLRIWKAGNDYQEDPWHLWGIPDPYPDRIRQILVEMPGTNPDKMGPKCLGTQIGNPDRSARKYYSMSWYPDKYRHGEKNLDITPKSSYLPRGRAREFRPVTDATLLFQTKQYLLLPSIQFLCLLDTCVPSDQALPYIEVTSDMDMERFKALKEGKIQLISALKLSRKRGGVWILRSN